MGPALEFFVCGFWDDEGAVQWLFILQQESGAWKIDGIEIMTPATPGGEDAALTPFSDLLAISLLDAHVP